MYEVTPADVEQYWQRGYWISPKLIDDGCIARLRRALDRVLAGEVDGTGSYFDGPQIPPQNPHALKRVINSWWVNDDIRDLVLDPGLGKMVAALMRVDRARVWG